MLELSVEQIVVGGVTFVISSVVGTFCWCWRERCRRKTTLARMDKATQNLILLERERRKRPQRQLERPRPPP